MRKDYHTDDYFSCSIKHVGAIVVDLIFQCVSNFSGIITRARTKLKWMLNLLF